MKMLEGFARINEFLLLLLFLLSLSISAQDLPREELEFRAENYFEQGDYEKAIEGFEKLISQFPEDPGYKYYMGRCYFYLNIEADKCIDYLSYGASKNINRDVHYFLFRAYFNKYRFDEAEVSLGNFKKIAKRKEKKAYNPEYWEQALLLAKKETAVYANVSVMYKDKINEESLTEYFLSKVNKEQKFYSVSNSDVTPLNNNIDEQFTLTRVTDNHTVFSDKGKRKRKKNGSDLYFTSIKNNSYKLAKGEVSPLKALNSRYNEKCPYFDQNSGILYFSSNRKGGLGGYDIYKAEYNYKENLFSPPERLKFPINTPSDDFLFVPDSISKTAVFVSNRESSRSDLVVYRIVLSEDAGYTTVLSVSLLSEIANLNKFVKVKLYAKRNGLGAVEKEWESDEFNELLQNALSVQLICDSLQSELVDYKNKLRAEENEENRKTLFSEVAASEKAIIAYQKEADLLFGKVLSYRGGELKKVPKETPQPKNNNLYVNKEINGIKQYTYYTKQEEEKIKKHDIIDNSDSIFKILSKSPYSSKQPIPRDLELPEGLVYRIQLGVFGVNVSMDAFGGLTPIFAETVEGKSLTRYFVGLFKTSKEARKALAQVKEYGYSDAFIVSYHEKQKVTIQLAQEIEFGEN